MADPPVCGGGPVGNGSAGGWDSTYTIRETPAKMKQILVCLFSLLAFSSQGIAQGFELRYERLVEALAGLNEMDRKIVDSAIVLIKRGDSNIALTRLNSLNKTHPTNSSLRILTAYTLLQAGNLLGAFEEAKKAESSPDQVSYKCWFLAKVAFINGDNAACKRELNHAEGDSANKADAAALRAEMQRKEKGSKP